MTVTLKKRKNPPYNDTRELGVVEMVERWTISKETLVRRAAARAALDDTLRRTLGKNYDRHIARRDAPVTLRPRRVFERPAK